jgi:hypothetical protein
MKFYLAKIITLFVKNCNISVFEVASISKTMKVFFKLY